MGTADKGPENIPAGLPQMSTAVSYMFFKAEMWMLTDAWSHIKRTDYSSWLREVKQQPKFSIINSFMAGERPREAVRTTKILIVCVGLFSLSCPQVKLRTFKTYCCRHFLTWYHALLYPQSFQLSLYTQSLKHAVIIYTVIIPSTLIKNMNFVSQWPYINGELPQGPKWINTPPLWVFHIHYSHDFKLLWLLLQILQ